MSEGDSLPISAVAEVLFCPRNFYYRVVEGAEDRNIHMLLGQEAEERRNARETLSRGERTQVRNVGVTSEQEGLHGVIDVLEDDGRPYPVEYKKGASGDKPHDQVQLCAQAMALEETLGMAVESGYIFYAADHVRVQVHFGATLRDLVRHAVTQARAIVADGVIPPPVNDARCEGCALKDRCMPAEVAFLGSGGEAPRRVAPGWNPERVLYVDRPGAIVRKQGLRLLVEHEEQTVAAVPISHVDEVVLVHPAQLTGAAGLFLLERQVPVSFVSAYSGYLGSLRPALDRNAVLRLAQARVHDDPPRRLALARAFVSGKLANQRTLLMRYRRSRTAPALDEAVDALEAERRSAEAADNLDQLRGHEGAGSRAYFRALPAILEGDLEFLFERRSRRPPSDPVNAMLGFGYALLLKDLRTALEMAGLDPYLGYLHGVRYGRPSLALDLMEEFRSIIVDAMVLNLISRGMVTAPEFEHRLGGCYLNDGARRTFLQTYQARTQEEIRHPLFGYTVSYRRIFLVQARLLSKVVMGELPAYVPFRVR